MKKLWLVLAAAAHASSFETQEEGKTSGLVTLFIVVGFFVAGSLTCLLSAKRQHLLPFVTELILFVQFSRWTLLFDMKTSPFYRELWQQLSYLLNWFGGSTLDGDLVNTYSATYFENAVSCLMVVVSALVFLGVSISIQRTKGVVWVLSAVFTITFFDLAVAWFVQAKNLSGHSAWVIVGFVIGLVLLLLYVAALVLITVGCVFKATWAWLQFFTLEFKGTQIIHRLYYPWMLGSRFFLAVCYGFADSGQVQFIAAVVLETLLVLYLLCLLPYRHIRNSVLSTALHMIELLLLSLPSLYETEDFDEGVLNTTTVILLWSGLGVIFLRWGLDYFFAPEMNIKKAPVVIPRRKPVVDATLTFNEPVELSEPPKTIVEATVFPRESGVIERRRSGNTDARQQTRKTSIFGLLANRKSIS